MYTTLRHLYTPHYFICIHNITKSVYTTLHLHTTQYVIRVCTFRITLSVYSLLRLLYSSHNVTYIGQHYNTSSMYNTLRHQYTLQIFWCHILFPHLSFLDPNILFPDTHNVFFHTRYHADTGRGLPRYLHRMQGNNLQAYHDLTLPNNLQEAIHN